MQHLKSWWAKIKPYKQDLCCLQLHLEPLLTNTSSGRNDCSAAAQHCFKWTLGLPGVNCTSVVSKPAAGYVWLWRWGRFFIPGQHLFETEYQLFKPSYLTTHNPNALCLCLKQQNSLCFLNSIWACNLMLSLYWMHRDETGMDPLICLLARWQKNLFPKTCCIALILVPCSLAVATGLQKFKKRQKTNTTNGSEKIRGCCSRRYDPLRVWDSTEKLGLSSVHILEDHDRCDVSTAVAVVGRWPHCYQLLIKHEFVSFMHQLVCTADELQIVDVDKLREQDSINRNKCKRTVNVCLDLQLTDKPVTFFPSFPCSTKKLQVMKLQFTSLVTLEPNSQPAPLGLIAQVSTSSGSDHTRSQKAPLWGISWLRSIVRIWSKVLISGERPPWTHRICSSINWD